MGHRRRRPRRRRRRQGGRGGGVGCSRVGGRGGERPPRAYLPSLGYCISHSPVRAGLHPFAVAAVILMPLKRAWALCDAPPQHHSRRSQARQPLTLYAIYSTARIFAHIHKEPAREGGGGGVGRVRSGAGGWLSMCTHRPRHRFGRHMPRKSQTTSAAPTTSTVAPTNPLDTHSLRRTHTPPRSMVGVRTAHSRTSPGWGR